MIRHNEIITKVAKDNNMPVDFVNSVYLSYWYTIREVMLGLPLKEDISLEEFEKLRPNINIPSLGKFYVLYPKYLSLRKKYLILQEIKNKGE